MTAPKEKTLQNQSGKWMLNKDLSDDFTAVLEMQGVNALIRKAVGAALVHLKITQPSENEFRMEQTAAAAAIPGTAVEPILDWEWRNSYDAFFGDIEGRSHWITQSEARDNGAEGPWVEHDSEGRLIRAVGRKPDKAWNATHLWDLKGWRASDGI